ncbi:SOS response-associated peptidase [Methylobacterium radiodurans]|uniref:Abasic site processing protein n=1 Tax=Methylobacterium radiodurans TaxID=2202828 RepID=A0A2U8VR62_9HYPH|nr:SOS response-associated peptidase family protein [Methylobacterium radiodurans]AWN35968.1 DUF159 family protein [Methylobacterium radiodurans]
MCNLYSLGRQGPDALRAFFQATRDATGNMPELPAIFPNTAAPVVYLREGERTLSMMRWGLPSPAFALEGRKVDPGVTNVRNVKSPHWRRWLKPEHRCLVPFASFSENTKDASGKAVPVWFAFGEERPLACFAGLKVEGWTSVRKAKDGETTDNLYAFLTIEPNAEVGAVHPKAMPVILTTDEERDVWLRAPTSHDATAHCSPGRPWRMRRWPSPPRTATSPRAGSDPSSSRLCPPPTTRRRSWSSAAATDRSGHWR